MATEMKIITDVQARHILVERIMATALKGIEFDLDPVDLVRDAVEKLDGDAMVIVNRIPEALWR